MTNTPKPHNNKGKIKGFVSKFKPIILHLTTFIQRFPTSVIALAFVSFLMNVSTSIVTATATTFVQDVLHNGVSFLITVRCLAEGFSYFIKVIVGVFSDLTKKRKVFLMLGYGGVLIIKPLFIIVSLGMFTNKTNAIIYAIAQISDRLLNATRDTPRDSLIADATEISLRTQSFGLRRCFASLGSQVGGFLALVVTFITAKYSILYTIASLPAFYSVYILYKNVQEPHKTHEEKSASWFSLGKLMEEKEKLKQYIFFMFIIFILSFGKFNEICLFQVANNLGYNQSYLISLYMFFYTTVALSSYFLSLTKRKDNVSVMLFSIFSLLITNFLMGYYKNIIILLVAILFSGIYVGITESVICGTISTIFPTKNMRATLFGIMNTVLGISICSSGFMVAILTKYIPLQTVYLYGMIPPLAALVLFLIFYKFIYKKID